MANFFKYYKWHLIFIFLIIVCIVFAVGSTIAKIEPDLVFGYIGSAYTDENTFNDNKVSLYPLLNDASGDNTPTINLNTYTIDLQKDINTNFADLVKFKICHIYIAHKDTFKAYEDKSVFAKLNPNTSANLSVLTKDDGSVYAVSLDNNEFMKNLGFNLEGYYIAAADHKNKEITEFEKNGINIANYIAYETRK